MPYGILGRWVLTGIGLIALIIILIFTSGCGKKTNPIPSEPLSFPVYPPKESIS